MVEYSNGHLDRTFHALAHPIRRQILARLAARRATVLDIAAWFDISLNGVSKHLKVLEQVGLITREIKGRKHFCALQPQRLQEAGAWIDYYRPFWEHRLDALDRFLDQRSSRGE
jgi:DNA-binding transcriptional ArsR family regulator